MKVTGTYVPTHMDTMSTVTVPGGYVRVGSLPEPPHYAVEISRNGSSTVYRGPIGQVLDKFFAECRRG